MQALSKIRISKMPRRTKTALLAVSLFALVAACGETEASVPDGQVVATIDGKDVTIHELNAEIGMIRAPAETPRKFLEQVALARVIERKMLATEARKLELDNRPQFLLSKVRAEEGLLVQALQADIQGNVPQTAREAAQKYIEENPQVFAERQLFSIDQIQFLRPDNLEALPLADAKTMGEVERVLVDADIQYRRAPQQVDTLTINPKLTTEILKITNSPNPEPFMFIDQPQGAVGPVVFINNVTGSKRQPFIGEDAISYAQNILQQQSVQKRLTSELEQWKEAYKPKIVYAEGYGEPDQSLLTGAADGAATGTGTETLAPAPQTSPDVNPEDALGAILN
jgi:EpsD family peptidyl-prolyl cis-trans isomerase